MEKQTTGDYGFVRLMIQMIAVPWLGFLAATLQDVAGDGETPKPIIHEDIGDENWGNVLTYLEYEEPDFDFRQGYTTDDFTDKFEGFMTHPTHPRSYGWDFSGWGEIPFAALLVGDIKGSFRYCMGVMVTIIDVIVPCACVRTYWFQQAKIKDKMEKKSQYYKNDLGTEIYVVANKLKFVEKTPLSKLYSKVNGTRTTKMCATVYDDPSLLTEEIDMLRYRASAAILTIDPELQADAVGWWPPDPIKYDYGPFSPVYPWSSPTADAWKGYLFYGLQEYTSPYEATIASYKYTVGDQKKEIWLDNFGSREIQVPNRLAELRVKLCEQTFCNKSEAFLGANKYLIESNQLVFMQCYCDRVYTGEEQIYQFMRDYITPHYTKTLSGGLLGAPVLSRGSWVAWIVEPVTYTTEPDTSKEYTKLTKIRRRGTLARGVDVQIINLVNEAIPQLTSGFIPHIGDKNRPNFVIRDYKLFVPDPHLHKDEVDLEYWSRIGYRPPEFGNIRGYSRSPTVLHTRRTFSVILMLNAGIAMF